MIRLIKVKLSNKKKKLLSWSFFGVLGAAACIPGIILLVKKVKRKGKLSD